MPIQTKVTGSAEYGKYMRAMFAGDPGSGKTLMASTFPDPYFISAEGGLMSIARKFIPHMELTRSDDLKEIFSALRQSPDARGKMLGVNGPVNTIVIDTIDEVSKLYMRERLKAKNLEAFKSYEDWGWLGDKVEGVIRSFRNLPLNVVFTSHLKEDKDEESGAIHYMPALYGQTARYLPGAVDLAFVLQSRSSAAVEDGKATRKIYRFAQTYGDNRFPWAKDRSGRLPYEFEMNFQDDYQRLFEAIYGGIDEEFAQEQKKQSEETAEKAKKIKDKFVQERPDPLKTEDEKTEAEFQAFAEQTNTTN